MTRLPSSLLLLTAALLAAAPLGCATRGGTGPYSPQQESARNSLEAQRLNQEAAELIDTKPAKAEELLRAALAADLYHGPAHNNLGVVYLGQGKLYEAAGEFEWARKLMPGHPDPRTNLGLTLERAGRTGEALRAYASALEASPGDLAATQALTRLQVRTRHTDARTRANLEEIALRGDQRWREWAGQTLASGVGAN